MRAPCRNTPKQQQSRMDARHAHPFVSNRALDGISPQVHSVAPNPKAPATTVLALQVVLRWSLVLFPPCCHDRSHLAANTRYSSSSSSSTFQAAKTHAEKTINPLLLSSLSPSRYHLRFSSGACVPRFSKHLLKVIISQLGSKSPTYPLRVNAGGNYFCQN